MTSAASAPTSAAALVRSMVATVDSAPVPAIKRRGAGSAALTSRIASRRSASVRLAASPFEPRTTTPSSPASVNQSRKPSGGGLRDPSSAKAVAIGGNSPLSQADWAIWRFYEALVTSPSRHCRCRRGPADDCVNTPLLASQRRAHDLTATRLQPPRVPRPWPAVGREYRWRVDAGLGAECMFHPVGPHRPDASARRQGHSGPALRPGWLRPNGPADARQQIPQPPRRQGLRLHRDCALPRALRKHPRGRSLEARALRRRRAGSGV